MAATHKLTPILLSLLLPLLLPFHPCPASSAELEDFEDFEDYTLDAHFPHLHSFRHRHHTGIRKGKHCHPHNNICNGVSVRNGTGLLFCCKKHCRNVLGDRNNCGKCKHKCKFGQLCCGGSCTSVGSDATHCGKCDNACDPGVICENGSCGYA
ncbi:protein GRIM REAPER-like [Malania oleifera]|uniref:protein GRIM REAPER-like n=1 Tax=Malania oleifera TaxID=397392 RepID=UPI0025AE539E|nr:protein GRIM REAPER-like [Malania oleifera]